MTRHASPIDGRDISAITIAVFTILAVPAHDCDCASPGKLHCRSTVFEETISVANRDAPHGHAFNVQKCSLAARQGG